MTKTEDVFYKRLTNLKKALESAIGFGYDSLYYTEFEEIGSAIRKLEEKFIEEYKREIGFIPPYLSYEDLKKYDQDRKQDLKDNKW